MAIDLIRHADVPVVDPTVYGMRGYATLYNVPVNYFWKIWLETGAFADVIARTGQRIPVTWSHNFEVVSIGQTRVLKSDDVGVWFEAPMAPTRAASEALGAVALYGRHDASISFDPGERFDSEDGMEHIVSVSSLAELGPTTSGACPGAYTEVFPLAEASWAGELPFMRTTPARTSDELSAALAAAVESTRSLKA
jgi:HK97 family phage prohead protease